jgi:tetratricopeptide (TPR) repeat protein
MPDMSPAAALLKSARLNFSRGELDAARALCAEVLESYPREPGALHLLGVIAHEAGDAASARDLLRRAAESPGTTALYVLTYADLCCKALDRQAAVDLARRATELDPALPLAWFYLGTLLLEMRRHDESRLCLERAVGLDGNFWQARAHLAVALGRAGDAAKAAAHFGCLLREQGGNAEIIGCFATFLADQGRYVEALAQAEQALAQRPDVLDHHLRAGEIEMLLSRHEAALARLTMIEAEWPQDARLLALKAQLLRSADRGEEAVALCRDAQAQGIESAELIRAYGLALQMAGEDAEALAAFDRSAAVNPAPALTDKGVLLAHLGQLDQACESFDEALKREPTSADAWYNKSNAKVYASEDPEIPAMERLLGQSSYRERMLLHFALGKAYMDAGDADQAFGHWHEGNRMKRANIEYDSNAAARLMARSAARPTADALAAAQADAALEARLSEAPVFVVGMPRCGSSLIEQILASHPMVYGAGELLRLRALFEADVAEPRAVAAAALGRLKRRAPNAARIIDKDLCNFLHLGVIHWLLPRARIIHCRRDPLDTCFSAYTKLFAGDFGFTYEQHELGIYYRDYHALMAHWRSTLPARIFMEIDYESLVSEPQRETRRLLEFLDLPWNDACMRFFETSRIVNTASFAQVRRPIYPTSIGGGLCQRSHLRPLIEALGDLALGA